MVDGPGAAARGAVDSGPGPRLSWRRCSSGCSPRPTGPRPPPSPAPRRPPTGSRSRPGRYAATRAPTSSSPKHWSGTTCCPRRWPRRVNAAQARAIVAALDRLPTTGEFAVSTEQRSRGRDPPGGAGGAPRREGATHPGRPDLRGDRPRPRRAVRRPRARGRRSPGAAAYDVHDVGGRRRHLPRTLPHPRPARADADQDDPRDQLTGAPPTTPLRRASTPTCPPRSATASR